MAPADAGADETEPEKPIPVEASPQACGAKRFCREMSSCEEAKHYLNDCGLTQLDGDGDGVPCNKLCRHR
ncbi:hypothetical protein DLM45_14080 [Hyphomicrobium methylovorum]|nr:hypothetical protein [Hyphomicrobium methylovorum]